MYDFMKVKSFERIREDENGFVFTPLTTKNSQILTRVFQGDKAISVALVGPKNSGKHSLLAHVLKELKTNSIHSSEIVINGEVCHELLIKMLRSTAGVKIKEQQKIIEGEVVSLSNDKIHLKTMDMDSIFEVGVRMAKEIQKERICVGDVIKIFKESCFVTRVGRASSHSASFRSDLLPIVPVPEGECIKNENIESFITLDELDTINYKENGEEYLYTNQIISEHIQSEVDKRIYKWSKEGKSILERGVLIIEDCEMMSNDSIQHIQACANNSLSPFIVLIFNQQNETQFNQGIKLNFNLYNEREISEIIRRIAGVIDESAIELLTELAKSKGLNYTLLILNSCVYPASCNSIKRLVDLFDI